MELGNEVNWHEQYYQIQNDCKRLVGGEKDGILDATAFDCLVPETMDRYAAKDANENLVKLAVLGTRVL